MSDSKVTVGFCGLGAMGFGMAVNLVKEGFSVKGYDVFSKYVERFREAGGIGTASLKESAEGSEHYVCMVANAQQAQSAIFSEDGAIAKTLPSGATLFLCSTVPSSYAKSVQKQLNEIGRSDIYFVDCPVSGGAKRAADGTLSIMAGASDAAMERAKHLLEIMSDQKKLFIVDGGIGAGSNMKMVHQILAGIQILAASEAMGFAARLGLDPEATMHSINGSDAWAWMFENRVPRMLQEDYFPGVSALTIILKDVSIITAMARLEKFPVPLSSIAEQVYMSALAREFGSHDDAGMVRMYFPKAFKGLSALKEGPIFEEQIAFVKALLIGIYLCSTAEAIAFAKHLRMPLDQFFELAADAAGGSAIFRKLAPQMIKGLFDLGEFGDSLTNPTFKDLGSITDELAVVVQKMQDIKSPSFLGSGALNLLLMAREKDNPQLAESCILKVWDQWCGFKMP